MTEFTKNDSGKLQWSLLPFEQVEEVVRVLMNGAEKYQRDNWKKCDDTNRYVDALLRHVIAYKNGQKNDTGEGGDGLPHLAHAVCNCLFLMWFDANEKSCNTSEKSCNTCKHYELLRICYKAPACYILTGEYRFWEKQNEK